MAGGLWMQRWQQTRAPGPVLSPTGPQIPQRASALQPASGGLRAGRGAPA